MAYIPIATDPTQPTDTVAVSTAASEFRALKLYLSQQLTIVTTGLGLRAPLASPSLTGAPTAPTALVGTNTTQVATTAFVTAAVTTLVTTAITPLPNVAIGPGVVTAAHGLGVVPSLVVLELVCVGAEFGYAIGDVIQITVITNGPNDYKLELFKNASLVGYVTRSTLQWQVANRAANGTIALTSANWALRFRVFK
jgi:hypothetical protein